ncbi:LysR substrate-binding domain-containing protein [Rugosimonospora acidiphila]|uniref:LysR substrate-binding domain-containing protein n=1 Tax=Rugosimonospora acidiphila TaxID=556531 RepID=A0ABP9RRF2_9ACTN
MDLDLRKLRYFVAVAEQRNFGRAAEVLRIAQPVLSRQIKALEDELHAQLFTRSRLGTELTAAGRQLLDDARPLLASATALQRRVRMAERGGSFTIGFMPGILVTQVARAFNDAYPDLTVDVLRTSYDDQVDVVHDGRADVSFVRMPIPTRGLRILPLFTEPRVVAVPIGHPLAGKPTVRISDLTDEHLLQNPDAVPEWRDIARELREVAPGDGQHRPAIALRTMEEKLEHVAAERGIIIVPRSTAALYTRPDIAYCPVEGISNNQVALAFSAQRARPEIERFAEIAVRMMGGPAAETD